jgi:hypothetical protein
VQAYERDGIEATHDMQRAARKVAQENSRLRRLLAHHGISQEEIDIYLRSFDEDKSPNEASTAPATAPVPSCSGMSGVIFAHRLGVAETLGQARSVGTRTGNNNPNHQCLTEHQLDGVCAVRHLTTPEPFFDARTQTEALSSRVTEKHYDAQENLKLDDSECPNTRDCFCPPTIKRNTQSLTSGLEISCDTAATIIIEMRGDGDVESVRKSLGCSGHEECNVRNSTVLQILDEG